MGKIEKVDSKFMDFMLKGDPACEYEIGTVVKKATYEEGDTHQIGTYGMIRGSINHPERGDAYIVEFEKEGKLSEVLTFIIGPKITKV